jgi:hypothetical protein
MAAGNMTNRESHRKNRKTKGQRDTEQPNANARKRRRKNCTAATSKNQPERSKKFRTVCLHK